MSDTPPDTTAPEAASVDAAAPVEADPAPETTETVTEAAAADPTGLEVVEAKHAAVQEAGVLGHTAGGEVPGPGDIPVDQPAEEHIERILIEETIVTEDEDVPQDREPTAEDDARNAAFQNGETIATTPEDALSMVIAGEAESVPPPASAEAPPSEPDAVATMPDGTPAFPASGETPDTNEAPPSVE